MRQEERSRIVFEPALLALYSPLVQEHSVRLHVEALRRRGYVWWARFSGSGLRLEASAARERWPHVARLAAKTERGEPVAVFLTDLASLHVCKVSEIAFGDDPPGGVRAAAPSYYADRAAPIWFRVGDVRALSFEQNVTLDWFDERLGPVVDGASRIDGSEYDGAYDPYAAIHYRFPIVISSPTVAKLFAADELPARATRFADSDDAIAPRRVQRAREELAKVLGTTWGAVSPIAQEKLANAWVQKAAIDRGDDIDPDAAFLPIAMAIEIELRDGLLAALEAHVREVAEGGSKTAIGVLECIVSGRGTDDSGRPSPWTLGSAVKTIEALVNRCRRALDELGLSTVSALAGELRFLKDVKDLRNATAHGESAPRGKVLAFVRAFFGKEHARLGAIAIARSVVAGRVKR